MSGPKEVTEDYEGCYRENDTTFRGNFRGSLLGKGNTIKKNLHGVLGGVSNAVAGDVHGEVSGRACRVGGSVFGLVSGDGCKITGRVLNGVSTPDITIGTHSMPTTQVRSQALEEARIAKPVAKVPADSVNLFVGDNITKELETSTGFLWVYPTGDFHVTNPNCVIVHSAPSGKIECMPSRIQASRSRKATESLMDLTLHWNSFDRLLFTVVKGQGVYRRSGDQVTIDGFPIDSKKIFASAKS